MLRRRIWIGALLICLLVGALVAAVETGGPDPPTVPMLRVGDTATYVFYDEGGQALGTRSFEVLDQAMAFDGGLRQRNVVKVASAFADINSTVEEWIELEDGEVVRFDFRPQGQGFREVQSSFRPRAPMVPFLVADADGSSSNWGSGRLVPSWTASQDSVDLVWSTCQGASSTAKGVARVDGHVVRELRRTFTCDDGEDTVAAWFGDASSFPVLIEFRVSADEWVRASLAGFTRGTGSEFMLHAPIGETRRPSEVGPGIPFRLADALVAADSDPQLRTFQSWRADHPDNVLVGARLNRGEHATDEAESVTWRLLYATDSGKAYRIALERGAINRSSDRGPTNVSAFDSSHVPDPQGAFDAALRAWRVVQSADHLGRTPNLAQWGVPFELDWDGDCPHVPESTGLLPLETAPSIVHVGFSSHGTCAVPKVERDESYVAFDARNGTLVSLVEHRIRLDEFPSGNVQRASVPSVAPVPPGLRFRAPDVVTAAAWGGGSFGVFMAIYFLPTLKLLAARALVVLGFTRLQRDELLDNSVREGLVEIVAAEPGVAATELKRRLGVGWGTTAYHLAVLEREGLLASMQYGRNRCFFPIGAGSPQDRLRMMVLRNPMTRAIHDSVHTVPGSIQEDLAKRFTMTPAGVLWHLRRLQEAGLIMSRRAGRKVHYFPAGGDPAR